MKKVTIELVSDIICPWCYIAKARIERVIQMLEAEDISVEIRVTPFQLYPQIPVGGAPKSDFAKVRKPGMGRSLRQEATEEDIKIDYSKIERIPNSLEAHRLLWLVEDSDQQFRLAKRLFKLYFEQGADLEEHELLIDEASKLGVAASTLQEFSETQKGQQEVNDYINGLRERFIRAVPTFILNDLIEVQGIQPVEVLFKYLKRAALMD